MSIISDTIYDTLTADARAGFSDPLSSTQEGNIRAWTDAIETGIAGVEARWLVIPPGGSLPTPSVTYRGILAIVQGEAGVADSLVVCLKDYTDAYNWITLS